MGKLSIHEEIPIIYCYTGEISSPENSMLTNLGLLDGVF